MNFLRYPIVRHVLAGVVLVIGLKFFVISPLEVQNENLLKELSEVRVQQIALIKELAQKDTYSIQNSVDGAKIKKGGEIKLIPDNNMAIVEANSDTISVDTMAHKERTTLGRFFYNVSHLFKKKR